MHKGILISKPANLSNFLTSIGKYRDATARHMMPTMVNKCYRGSLRYVHTGSLSTGLPSDRELKELAFDEFGQLRNDYQIPKYKIVLCHGLFGFETLRMCEIKRVGIPPLATVYYWKGIKEALQDKGIQVLVTQVPKSASIAARAQVLYSSLLAATEPGEPLNLIAHSMGGCDARYMLSNLTSPSKLNIKSLTTIATPHHGSAFADYLLDEVLLGTRRSQVYAALERLGMQTDAFAKLTRRAMAKFNEETPDALGTKYYSYGASFLPSCFSMFKFSHSIIATREGENDGLVSVESSKHGTYLGTVRDVSHLDLINWINRVDRFKSTWGWLWGAQSHFNAIAFYLAICHSLAKEGF